MFSGGRERVHWEIIYDYWHKQNFKPLMPGSKLQFCLSTYDLLLTPGIKSVIKILLLAIVK